MKERSMMEFGHGQSSLPVPHSVLEGGGENASILLTAIARGMDGLPCGKVLEVVSLAPQVQVDVIAWCQVHGNELVALLRNHEQTRFWIRKHES